MQSDLWTYRQDVAADVLDLDGFDVEARDGSIGKIDDATSEVGSAFIVVDTGPWIFGRKVMIPAAAIDRLDLDNRTAFLALTKDQIKDSPELDSESMRDDVTYRDRLGSYYDAFYDGDRWV